MKRALPANRADALFNPARLCLNSRGGSYEEGLAIAKFLTESTVGTALTPNAVCASACALVFMAGSAPWKGQLKSVYASFEYTGISCAVSGGAAPRSRSEGVYGAGLSAGN